MGGRIWQVLRLAEQLCLLFAPHPDSTDNTDDRGRVKGRARTPPELVSETLALCAQAHARAAAEQPPLLLAGRQRRPDPAASAQLRRAVVYERRVVAVERARLGGAFCCGHGPSIASCGCCCSSMAYSTMICIINGPGVEASIAP
jgi:hypothetical protein